MQARASFKQRLRQGEKLVGVRTQFCSSMVAEALGWSGCDYVYIDMEHSPNTLSTVVAQCQALGESGTHAVVRIPSHDVILIQQLLDFGVDNIVVPMIDTGAQARSVAAATRYVPEGIRSMSKTHRGNRFGAFADYHATIGDRVFLGVQIESKEAVGDISEIAAVDGVDAILFGPADLAASVGHPTAQDHPDVLQLISDAIPKVLACGKLAGMSTGNPASASKWLDKGCHFISIGGDMQMLVGAARHACAQARPAQVAAA